LKMVEFVFELFEDGGECMCWWDGGTNGLTLLIDGFSDIIHIKFV